MIDNVTYKKLGEIATYVNGYAFKPDTWSEKGLPIIRIQNLNNSEAAYNYYEGDLPAKFIVEKGDLLISWSASLGSYFWQGEKAYLNQHIFKVVFDKSDIDKTYLKYAVDAKLEEMKRKVHGATMQHIVKKDFDDTLIPVPSLEDQQRIVRELDAIHAILSAKNAQLRELDNLAQAIFYDMFGDPITNEKGWEVKTFGEIGTFKRGGGFLKSDFVEHGIPCIHYGQIHTKFGEYTTSHLSKISPDLAHKTRFASHGDLIIAITSEDLEGSCKSTAWLGNYEVAVGAHAAIYKHNQNAVYLSYYTKTAAFFHGKEKYARGFKVMEIKPDDIAKISVMLPPLALQQAFASKITAIEQQKARIRASIAETESLLAARMQYHFD